MAQEGLNLSGGVEGSVEKGVWGGTNNTKDLSKRVRYKQQKVPEIDTSKDLKSRAMGQLPYNGSSKPPPPDTEANK